MLKKLLKINLESKIGWYLFITSLVFYCLIKLPLNLSVACSSTNEGFFFVYGMNLLKGNPLNCEPLFVALYALVLKVFGFGTMSIIAVHFIQTLIVILNGILIYLLTKKILQDDFLSGLAVLFWILIQITPIGNWGPRLELESTFSLEAESICVFLSLCSIYLLTLNVPSRSFLAGFLSMCSIMFKSNGSIISISVLCWFFYFLIFEKSQIKFLKHSFVSFVIGFFVSLLFFNIIIYFVYGNLFSYWFYQYSIGSYSREFLQTPLDFLKLLLGFMRRHVHSMSNLVLYLSATLLFIWGLIRNFVLKENLEPLKSFLPLLSIWGIGNVCAVLAPGAYGSYYYFLLYPAIAIFLVLGLRDLFKYVELLNKKLFKVIVVILVLAYFIHRLCSVFPYYLLTVSEQIKLNFLLQEESFLDPVTISSSQQSNSRRPSILRAADFINNQLPDKNDTFYVFNFSYKRQHQDFSPSFYIYAKRLPPTTIFSDFLHYPNFLEKRSNTLIRDLEKAPPKIFVVPAYLYYVGPWQEEALRPFFNWFWPYLEKGYHFKGSFDYLHYGLEKIEEYNLYERN